VIKSSLSPKAQEVIFQDAIQRDLPTARRAALLHLLWNERFLTRVQLIARVDQKLGKNCFGKFAWEDNFYRDMRVVKEAFRAAGFHLAYSRSKERSGYYLTDEPLLSPELKQLIKSGASEVDQRQIDIYHQLSPAGRFYQGCAISDTARQVVSYRIRLENPEICPEEANRFALQRAYSR
jgi:hypothetical protein